MTVSKTYRVAVKILLFIFTFMLFNSLLGISSVENDEYDYSFSPLELFLAKYKTQIDDNSNLCMQVTFDQPTPFLFYSIQLEYDFKKKEFTPEIKSSKPVRFSVEYIDNSKKRSNYRLPQVTGKVEIASCDQTQLYGANKDKIEICVTVAEIVISEDSSFPRLIAYKTIATIYTEAKRFSLSRWEKVLPK